MLATYDPGLERAFNELGADVTDERKANLRRTIREIDVMIEQATVEMGADPKARPPEAS